MGDAAAGGGGRAGSPGAARGGLRATAARGLAAAAGGLRGLRGLWGRAAGAAGAAGAGALAAGAGVAQPAGASFSPPGPRELAGAPGPGGPAPRGLRPKVVSYNVLSSHLCEPSHFRSCAPEHLDPVQRLEKVKAKVRGEMAEGALISLQEVSMTWAGPLHAMFQQQGWHFVCNLYGGKHSNYMGVGIAVPPEYEVLESSIARLSDTKRWPRPPPPGFLGRLKGAVAGPAVGLWRRATGRKAPTDPMEYSQRRYNSVVFLRLRCRRTGGVFCLATYHMPCAFWSPPVMVIHVAMLLQHVQRLAAGDECILCGDFNIQPGDAAYNLITRGTLSEEQSAYPPIPAWDSWRPSVEYAMKSAYKDFLGREPDFTNYAQTREDPVFIETLDYIFCSPGFRAVEVRDLPQRGEVAGPLPNAEEPSDHIMLGATLELN